MNTLCWWYSMVRRVDDEADEPWVRGKVRHQVQGGDGDKEPVRDRLRC